MAPATQAFIEVDGGHVGRGASARSRVVVRDRVLVLKDAEQVRLVSRRNKDLTRDFPSVAAAAARVRAATAILDGEIGRFSRRDYVERTAPELVR